jgi:DNA polymerase IV
VCPTPRDFAGYGSAHERARSGMRERSPEIGECSILHVDMDSFFASVEVLDDPSLAGKPLIVGGSGTRGVVASCTYEARAYGIHSAMPSVQARRRCPHAVFVPGRYERYSETSDRLREVLLRYTPLLEPISLDEAFLDVSGAGRLFDSPVSIAHQIRRTVKEDLSLDCSVGVARTKLLAKLASRAAKPVASLEGVKAGRGVVTVLPDEEIAFLHPLPITALWGVGPSTGRQLATLGVKSVGDLARIPEARLCRLLGAANGRHLAALAQGDDERSVEPAREIKSVGHEETFAVDLHTHEELHQKLVRMADAVAARLREANLKGRTVTLKVRYGDRQTVTRSQTLPTPTLSARAISVVASALLEAVEVHTGVRLIGVAMSSLSRGASAGQQLSFDSGWGVSSSRASDAAARRSPSGGVHAVGDARGAYVPALKEHPTTERDIGWEEVEAAVAQIRTRYGQAAIGAATLVTGDGISVKRRGDSQWGPQDSSTEPDGPG